MGAPQDTVLSHLLFALYKLDVRHTIVNCHLQFSVETAIVGPGFNPRIGISPCAFYNCPPSNLWIWNKTACEKVETL